MSHRENAVRFPGFVWLISPTKDWQLAAPDAFRWVTYTDRGDDGLALRSSGYSPSAELAREMVDAILAVSPLCIRPR